MAVAALAWVEDDLVALLGTFAAALAPELAIGLNCRRVDAGAATASIVTGTVLNLGLEFLVRQTMFPTSPRPPFGAGVWPDTVALAASVLVLLAFSVRGLRNGPREPHPDVAAVMEM